MANDMLFAEERKIKIVEYIQKHLKATVPELCAAFAVSSATIRNDLRELEQSSLILRTHGGAMVKTKTGFELTEKQKLSRSSEEKRKIARLALDLIEDGDTIILDTGTTAGELARLLHEKKSIHVVTSDFNIASILEDFHSVDIILLGGVVRKGFHCTIGASGRGLLSSLMVDKAFMGANSFSFETGASTPDINQAETKKAMIEIAAKVVLLCDSSKLGKSSFARFASVDQIDILVTDAVSKIDRQRLEEIDIEVVSETEQ
jgi:DeoR family transcriptional regulator, fructose operon transcriptional repressor